MELIDYDLEKDLQTVEQIKKAANRRGQPTKHLFRTRSAKEVTLPYTKASTWTHMAEEVKDANMRRELIRRLAKTNER